MPRHLLTSRITSSLNTINSRLTVSSLTVNNLSTASHILAAKHLLFPLAHSQVHLHINKAIISNPSLLFRRNTSQAMANRLPTLLVPHLCFPLDPVPMFVKASQYFDAKLEANDAL